jgi:transcriptional regulator with XRE-family HTH domain
VILGKLLLGYRQSRELTVREMAKEIGIPTATLNRVERDKPVDTPTFMKLLNYIYRTEEKIDARTTE